MISEAAMLIESQDEESILPLGRVAQSLVDALDELLTLVDGRGRVERLVAAALRVDPGELGKGAGGGIGIELLQGLQKGYNVSIRSRGYTASGAMRTLTFVTLAPLLPVQA